MRFNKIKKIDTSNVIIYIAFIFIFIIFSILLSKVGFLTVYNLMNIGRQSSLIAIAAVGTTLVLAGGEIDLSLGSTISLTSLITALAFRINSGYLGIFLSVILPVATGIIVGIINGFFVSRLKIPSFLSTLGMMGIISGLARWITHMKAIPIANKKFTYFFGSGDLHKIPILFFWVIFFIIIGAVILYGIPLGKKILATGGNETAAYFSGINTKNIKWAVFLINGAICGFVGILIAGRLGGARYDIGDEMLLTVIAATVLGGTALFGGKASIYGAIVGALLLTMLNNGILLFGLDVPQQMIIRGFVIILAVAASMKGK